MNSRTMTSAIPAKVKIDVTSAKEYMVSSVYGQNRLVRVEASTWKLLDVLGVGLGLDRPIGVHYYDGFLYTTVIMATLFHDFFTFTKVHDAREDLCFG